MRFKRKVLHGEKLGRKLSFPTVNFHVGNFGEHYQTGVYSSKIWLQAPSSKLPAYLGALYFGPKGPGKNVLEIHILDFEGDLYGKFVHFEMGKKIRKPKAFKSLDILKKAIKNDVAIIRTIKR